VTVPRVLVTDAGRGSAITVIRSLGRHGIDVIVADHRANSPGFRSRYAAARVLYPDPASAPDEVVDTLLAAAREHRVDLIVPVSDEVLLPLSAARERFAGVCALAAPEPEALACVTDKAATVALAHRVGVPIPPTAVVRTADEAQVAARDLGWPVVVKPAASRVYRSGGVEAYSVAYAGDARELAERMARLEGCAAVLLQGYRGGEGHGVELLMDRGRPLAAFQHRRLHEVPITGGASALRESVALDPALYDYSLRLMRELRWTGLAMVEFRVGPGGPVLMEVNGRIWGSLPLAVKSGVDFPLRLAELCLDRELGVPAAADDFALGVRSRNLGLELVWVASVLRKRRRYPYLPAPRRRAGLTAALRLALPRDGFDVLDRDDPAPGLLDAAQVASRLVGKVRHAA